MKNWKQPKWSSVWVYISKLWYICIMDYVAIKKNEVNLYVLTWRGLRMYVNKPTENLKLTEVCI